MLFSENLLSILSEVTGKEFADTYECVSQLAYWGRNLNDYMKLFYLLGDEESKKHS